MEKANIQIVAVSYDDVNVLAKFAEAEKIKFSLLSDPESKTIEAYGIRNEQAKGRTGGIPHPGTFLVDTDGIVRAKLFYKDMKKRHHAEDIIAAAKVLKEKSKRKASN